jgi:hypothetical protein
MSEDDASAAERLRARFAAPPHGAAASDRCADADRIWLAARGELPWSETEALLDHVTSCAACTVAWRLAREQSLRDGVSAEPGPKGQVATGWRRLGYGAAAAVVLVAAGLVAQRWPQREAEVPAFRATSDNAIQSLVPDASELRRSAFELRWSPGPAGTRYAIRVTDEHLSPIADAAGLDVPEFRVPEAALGALAPGAKVLWRVEAVFPDGARVTSETFLSRVGTAKGP